MRAGDKGEAGIARAKRLCRDQATVCLEELPLDTWSASKLRSLSDFDVESSCSLLPKRTRLLGGAESSSVDFSSSCFTILWRCPGTWAVQKWLLEDCSLRLVLARRCRRPVAGLADIHQPHLENGGSMFGIVVLLKVLSVRMCLKGMSSYSQPVVRCTTQTMRSAFMKGRLPKESCLQNFEMLINATV